MTLSYPIMDDVSRAGVWGRTSGVLGDVTLVGAGARFFCGAGREAPELLTAAGLAMLSGAG